MKFLIINGVNLNMLGLREPEIYGNMTLLDVEKALHAYSFELEVDIETFQSNHEGEIVEKIQNARNEFDGIVLNAGAYTHTSVAIRDAISSIDMPVVEVHLTNIHKREEFRHKSLLAMVCLGQISGFHLNSYKLGLKALVDYINDLKS